VSMSSCELLSVEEMYRADAAAAAAGVPSLALMEAAGHAVVRVVRQRWKPRRLVILCGPGNNGGDGYVAARLLAARGWPVRVYALGDPAALRGDAAVNAGRWRGKVHPLAISSLDGDPLIVDALFGAGLTRPLDGVAAAVIEGINRRTLDCVGVDVPSGVDGNTGEVKGTAPRCRATVTFFRAKPGHLLLPGRDLAGDLTIADIGIPDTVLGPIAPQTWVNQPALWIDRFPWPGSSGNKYTRGHAVVVGGDAMTGAAQLAAEAARRVGAGLVTIAADAGAYAVYAGGKPGTIVARVDDDDSFTDLIADRRRNAVLIGPGAGASERTRRRVLEILALGRTTILDADALTVFRGDPGALFGAITGPAVLTPHDGEFARIFDPAGDRLIRARRAAAASGAVVLLKGSDTVIAAPDGRAAINANAPPDLATAGSGDVLAGTILGLAAQGLPAFEAACAAAFIHARGAAVVGRGLIAEDVIEAIPAVLTGLHAQQHEQSGTRTLEGNRVLGLAPGRQARRTL
jgi:yjeF C-terminal region, hydroxyethylthiazole kinase-related/yjeF N-terminal region